VKQFKKGIASDSQHCLSKLVLCGVIACIASTPFAASAYAQQTPPPAPQPPKDQKQHSTELPPGPGRDTVMRVCSKCHSPNLTVANPRDRQGWEDTITKMSGLGAMATDDEFTEILDYLSKYVSPTSDTANAKVNVNKATAAELSTALELPAKDAEAVVAYRTKNGDFKTLDDLKKVPELDAKKLDEKKDKLTF
jgi:competence protein ComEA